MFHGLPVALAGAGARGLQQRIASWHMPPTAPRCALSAERQATPDPIRRKIMQGCRCWAKRPRAAPSPSAACSRASPGRHERAGPFQSAYPGARSAEGSPVEAVIFEEHSSVLPHGVARGVRSRTLVYLDAHLDLQPVGAAALQRLRDCADATAVRVLEAAHPFGELEDRCFGIEDFLHPAAQLGCIRHLVWVAPPQVWRAGFGAALSRLVQLPGITLDDLATLRRSDDGCIVGRLLGLDLTLCALPQLAQQPQQPLPADWLLDVDADYFVELPGDQLWADPLAILAALRALPGAPVELTISRAVGRGFTPLRHRFQADLLAAAWTGDTPAAQALHPLVQADGLLWPRGQRAACVAACASRPAPRQRTTSAPAPPTLPTSAPHTMKPQRDATRPTPTRSTATAPARTARLPFDRAGLARWQHRLEAGSKPARSRLEAGSVSDALAAQRAWVGLGLLHAALGDANAALHAWAQTPTRPCTLGRRPPAPGPAIPNWRWKWPPRASPRAPTWTSARHCSARWATPAPRLCAFGLATRAEAHAGRWPQAMRWQQQAVGAMPTHPGLWQQLARCCQGLGDVAGARAARARQAALQSSLAAIAARLNLSSR